MLNKVFLIGNLGADPETKYTQGGKCVAELRVATTFGFGDSEKTEWHRVVVWEKAAEACGKYLKKGSKVFVDGRIQNRAYDDKEGNKRYITEIVANDVKFLNSKSDKGATGSSDSGDDDIPF